jgi:hypothetical protein
VLDVERGEQAVAHIRGDRHAPVLGHQVVDGAGDVVRRDSRIVGGQVPRIGRPMDGGPDIEPDYPQQVAVTTEITSDGPISGPLWGSNLSLLTHLVGTPYMPDIEGGILYLEEIGEAPYAVERMLLQLFHAGILQRQKALIFADFCIDLRNLRETS